jgi:glycosyltransferase involved in cell wall biosynthesis
MAKLGDPRVHYAIAGIGNKIDELTELANTLGIADRVHLLGYRRDIPELNSSADAFCFPSLREGLGMGSIEAMSCGLPIITSNVHGINDYSIDGVTGYKCSPHDTDGFAGAIKKLLDDPDITSSIGESNKEHVKRYSIGNVLPIMKSIYES